MAGRGEPDEASGKSERGTSNASAATRGRKARGPGPGAHPRGARDEATRRMLDAAAALFAERPVSSVTVRDIADRAGVSHALVHRYLGSKDDIFRAVLDTRGERLRASLDGLPDLREVVVTLLRELRHSEPQHLRIIANAVASGVRLEDIGFDWPSFRLQLELARREFEVAGRTGTGDAAMAPNILTAALTALATGWMILETALVPLAEIGEYNENLSQASLERAVLWLIDAALRTPDGADIGGSRASSGEPPSAPAG